MSLSITCNLLPENSIVFFFSPNEPDGLEVQRKWSVFKNWQNKTLKNLTNSAALLKIKAETVSN